MFDRFFEKPNSGKYILLSSDILIYQENSKIVECYQIIANSAYDFSIINKKDDIVLGPFKNLKIAEKALKKMSRNKGIKLSPFITIALIIIMSFSLGHNFHEKTTSGLASNIPMVPMGMDTDGPSGLGNLPMPPTVGSKENNTSNKETNNKLSANDLEVSKKLEIIRNAVQSGKPLTENMFDGIPKDLANQIKQAAIQVQRFQKEPAETGLGQHNNVDVKSSANTSVVKEETPEDKLAPVILNPKLKVLEDKHQMLKDITSSNDPTPISPTSSDYKNYNDFLKDYPDLSKK